MNRNTYVFMLLTGKYLPKNDIVFDELDKIYYFRIYNVKLQLIYFENSRGYWAKTEYNEQGQIIYYETSSKGVILDER